MFEPDPDLVNAARELIAVLKNGEAASPPLAATGGGTGPIDQDGNPLPTRYPPIRHPMCFAPPGLPGLATTMVCAPPPTALGQPPGAPPPTGDSGGPVELPTALPSHQPTGGVGAKPPRWLPVVLGLAVVVLLSME